MFSVISAQAIMFCVRSKIPFPLKIHNGKCLQITNFMMTSSNRNIFRVGGLLCGELTNPRWSPHKDQWREALIFSLICVWTNDWATNPEAGDLRRHRVHYDVPIMYNYSHMSIWSMGKFILNDVIYFWIWIGDWRLTITSSIFDMEWQV